MSQTITPGQESGISISRLSHAVRCAHARGDIGSGDKYVTERAIAALDTMLCTPEQILKLRNALPAKVWPVLDLFLTPEQASA